MFDKQDDSGVSPVIGVILMVAVTVALVALVTVTVFDLGGDVSESPDATVQLEQFNPSSGDVGVRATLLRNENVDNLRLEGPDDSDTIGDAAGDTGELTGTDGDDTDLSVGEQVNVIAVMPDGNEEVLTSTTAGE